LSGPPGISGAGRKFHCISSAIPLLLKYQGTGKIHAFIQEFKLLAQRVDLDGWLGVVEFGEKPTRWAGKRLAA